MPTTPMQTTLTALELAQAGHFAEIRELFAPWEPPGYADSSAFTEHEVTLACGRFSVPGTLAVPDGPGPHAGVVLARS